MPSLDAEPVALTDDDLALILDALDSHEYWQLSEPSWRNSGAVILPTDDARFWLDRPSLSRSQREAIEEIERCRELSQRVYAHREIASPRDA